MLSQMKLKLRSSSGFKAGNYISSLLQGVLMERISPEYADKLHISGLHPYSQYVLVEDDEIVWTVNTLEKEARSGIIDALGSIDFTEIYLRQKDLTLNITGRSFDEITYDDLLNRFYIDGSVSAYIMVEFITPTAFKSNGKYTIFPTARLILNSLVKKYDAFSHTVSVGDELLYEYISEHTDIVEYCLRSTKFPMEGVTIPSFIGSVKLKCSGNKEFRSLINMLLKFGEYSGVGIKNSMGMGAIKVRLSGGKKTDG